MQVIIHDEDSNCRLGRWVVVVGDNQMVVRCIGLIHGVAKR